MTTRHRWAALGAIGCPLLAMTAYLLWLWPRPRGDSLLAETGPYLLSLLTGVPFVLAGTRGVRRTWVLLAFLGGGFVVLWLFALAVLCGVRGVCL